MKRFICGTILLAFASTACANVLSAGAAVVNGARISQGEVESRTSEQLSNPQGAPQPPGDEGRLAVARRVLQQLIQQELLRQEAARRKIVVAASDIDRQFEGVRGQFASEAEFAERLKEFGLTRATLRGRIADSLLAGKLRDQLVPAVTEREVASLYEQQREQFRQVRVKHILFGTDPTHPDAVALKEANAALARLRAGEDFARLAKQLSDDASSKDRGGQLSGFVSLAELDPGFGRAAWDAKIGVVTKPVRSQFGYHVIVTLAKRVQPLSEVGERIRQQLQQQAGDRALEGFLAQARARATIIVNPRYGDWDPRTGTIVPHRSFVPADRDIEQDGGGFVPPPGLVPPPG